MLTATDEQVEYRGFHRWLWISKAKVSGQVFRDDGLLGRSHTSLASRYCFQQTTMDVSVETLKGVLTDPICGTFAI